VTEDARPYGRRAFLALVAGGVTSLWWARPASRVLSPLTSSFSQLAGNLFPVGGWRIYTISGSMPIFDRREWSLRIDGLVRRPVSLTYDEVLALPRAHQVSNFHCVTGWSVDGVRWSGVRLHELLRLAEPLPSAQAIRFVSAEEPYDDSLTLEQALLPNVMLALEMDGSPLAKQPTGYWEGLGYDQNAWVGRSNGYSS
jgi:hypothetical protein